jgi:hypothetical protein
MRPISKLALLGALTATLVAAPAAMAGTLTVGLKPNKGGTPVVGAPSTITTTLLTPGRAPTTDGNQQITAIEAKLPTQLLFNTIPFSPCNKESFVSSGSCPSASKIGDAVIKADGGPDVGVITSTATMYFGSGFTVLAKVNVDKPTIINDNIVGELRSSGTTGYGLSLYIPVPDDISHPLGTLYPTVTNTVATIKSPVKKTSVKGLKGKTTIPLVGLGPCKGALPFQINIKYRNLAGALTDDGGSGSGKCTK